MAIKNDPLSLLIKLQWLWSNAHEELVICGPGKVDGGVVVGRRCTGFDAPDRGVEGFSTRRAGMCAVADDAACVRAAVERFRIWKGHE